MKKAIVYAAAASALILLPGCSKKLGQFQSGFFSTDPTPLETKGYQVPATITGRIPAKFMVKNAKVTATPSLVWAENGNMTEGVDAAPVVFQGENVRDNGQVVPLA